VTEEEYIGIVGEIFDGYTEITYEGCPVYIKHFSIRDQRYIHRFYNKYKTIAEEKGIPCEEEMLSSLRENGIWTDDDDKKICSLEQEIEGLKGSHRVVLLPSHKKSLQKTIAEKQIELITLLSKKREVVGKTSESYGSQRSNEEFIRYLLYKDHSCQNHLFNDKDFAELSEDNVSFFVRQNEQISERLQEKYIQEAVLRDFFNMYLSQTENVSTFYGKPIVELSAYQLKLALYARVFFNIFQYHEDIPEHIKKDPEAIFNFVDTKKGVSKVQEKFKNSDSGGSAVFNATKEDLEVIDPNAKKVSLTDEIAKKGGAMTMDDFINLMG
jgi:hypothetical protein